MNKMPIERTLQLVKCCSYAFALAIIASAMNSCAPSKCLLCDTKNNTLYNVELKDSAAKINGKHEIPTFFAPVPMEVSKKKTELYVVDCEGAEPYRLPAADLEQFIKKNIVKIDTTEIKRIVTTSDADFPPKIVDYKTLTSYMLCNRHRSSIKIELRGMLAFRNFDNGGIFYPGFNGGTYYEKETFSSGIGGTKMGWGAEAAILPRVKLYNNRNSLNIGVLTGYWPVDGSNFIPLAIHPRFTINDVTSPLWGNCNAWYAFGDLGTAIDSKGAIPLIVNDKPTSWFWGVGLGHDFWLTKGMDLSVDLGYRYTSLSLPANEDYKKCIEDNNLKNETPYPVRKAGQLFIRVGLTW